MSAPGRWERAADGRACIAVVAIALFASLAFLHRHGIADADAMVMAAGLAHGLQPGVPFRESLLYGPLISPGFYPLFHALGAWLSPGRSGLVSLLNATGVLGAGLAAGALFALYRGTLSRGAALAATLVFVLSPVAWENGTSFHPIGLALPLLLLGALAFAAAERDRRWGMHGLATLLTAAALAMRNEVAIAFPALLVAAALSPGRGRTLARTTLALAAAVALYLLTVRVVNPESAGPSGGLVSAAVHFAGFLRVSASGRSLVWAVFTMGIATTALAALGAGRLARDPAPVRRRSLIVALTLAVPGILVWLPNTTAVMRHYLLALPALTWIVGAVWLERLRGARLALATLAVIAANLLLPEALYARLHLVRHTEAWPNGTFFSAHQRTEMMMERAQALEPQGRAAAEGGADRGMFVSADWRAYGHFLYGMAQAPVAYRLRSTSIPYPGAFLFDYQIGSREVRVLLSQVAWSNPGPTEREPLQRTLAAELAHAQDRGLTVVVPRDVADLIEAQPDLRIAWW